MRTLLKTFSNLLLLAVAIGLTACSSGGDGGGAPPVPTYNGTTTAATVNSDNAQALSITATEATTKAIANQDANTGSPLIPGGVSISPTSDAVVSEKVTEIAHQIAAQTQLQNSPLALTISYTDLGPDYCGGSVSVPDSALNSPTLDFIMTFSNLCYDAPNDGLGQIVMNGQVRYTESSTSIRIQYINFRVTMDGQTQTLNFTMTCDIGGSSCTYSSDYVGSDGNTYRMENFNVTGSDTSGYMVSAKFYHPDYGSIDVTTDPNSPLMFNCTQGPQPSSGSLAFNGANGTSGSITFDNCTSYTYCYGSSTMTEVCDTGMW